MSADVGRVIAANATALLAYFERRVTPVEDAADLASEVMLVAWRRRAHVPGDETEARMWLFGIARMTLAGHARTARRRTRLAAKLRDELGAWHRAAEASQPADDIAVEVRTAVDALPDGLGEIVRLVHWDGFSLAEIARLLGTPAPTVRSRYARARRMLAAQLGADDDPDGEAAGPVPRAEGAEAVAPAVIAGFAVAGG